MCQMHLGSKDDPDGLRYMARLLGVLRAEREARKWTALRLAKESGVHLSVIQRAEKEERFPGVPVLVRICRAMDLPFWEVCRRAEPKEEE
jgi:transcriptional regulator with XRE-family HTH domain